MVYLEKYNKGEYMKRIKTFIKYLIIFLIVYFGVNFLSFQIIKSTYKTKGVSANFTSPSVEISDSKATITNGYINGKVTNTTGNTLENQYLKLDFFSKRDVNVGTKYIDLGTLEPNAVKDFSLKYNFDNVDNIVLSVLDKSSIPEEDLKLLDFSSDNLKIDKYKEKWYVIYFATIIALC